MRIGLLTDIHGDYDTMARVLAHLEGLRVDRLICLGDLVVHGAHNNRVVDHFRRNPDIRVVKGNHDLGATLPEAQLDGLHFFSASSRENTLKARAELTAENKAYLEGLPLDFREGEVFFTHATPGNPFALLRKPETVRDAFAAMPSPIMIAGHTHRTRVHHWPAGKPYWCTEHPVETGRTVVELTPGDRYILNLGATAQLKYDFFPPVCAVFEPRERRLEFHELEDLRPEKPTWP